MNNRPERVRAKRVTVYCPVAPETLSALARGELAALTRDPVGGRILGYIEGCPEFGNFGSYTGVCEVAIGLEAFTPAAHARPALGAAGARSHSATAAITTYASEAIAEDRLEVLLQALCALHPWEVPVIEVTAVTLIRRRA